ncbi:hypothetical protein ACFOQM_00540 [Paenibacillus sp. GCM10012307]|uniref:DUF948 domain-containing protein n=1 Tax=Paenibacillus roseus TaxID=2798579 RepID=A0A934J2T4_9BACL|nr:DUF948 domain-containing protein [Paenibacillus roseus]MBJ6359811.1 DUF948 domain-containing protein [Paenibacillus roseus]
MILIICASIATAAFIVLVIAMIFSMRSIVRDVKGIAHQTKLLQQQTAGLLGELRRVLTEAEQAVAGTGKQMKGFLHSASLLGESFTRTAGAVNELSSAVTRTATARVKQTANKYGPHIEEALNWAEAGLTAWHWWQKKCSAASKSSALSGQDEGHDK